MSYSLYIPASRLSAVLGRNPYEAPKQAIMTVLQRWNRPLYDRIKATSGGKGKEIKDQIVHDMVARIPSVRAYATSVQPSERLRIEAEHDVNIVKEAVRAKMAGDKAVVGPMDQYVKPIVDQIDPTDHCVDVEKIANVPRMDRGTAYEKNVFDILRSQGMSCRPNRQHFSRQYTYKNLKIIIGGVPDGFNIEFHEVIEIKTRANRLFDSAPIYELDQLCVYVTTTKNNSGILVQSYKGDTNVLCTMTLGQAEERMKQLLTGIYSLAENIITAMSDKDAAANMLIL